MAGGGGSIESGEPEFQIAPMIDVLLVILIFFMTITSTQVLQADKTITLPLAPNAQKKDNTRSEAVINVRWVDNRRPEFNFNYRNYPNAQAMVESLRTARTVGEQNITVGQNPTFRAVIRGDRNVPALHVSQAMNACAEAGISDISFSAINRE
jgi:biopolymer transport protein ExbD